MSVERSQQEIQDRVDRLEDERALGFEIGVLVRFLEYENAEEFLKDDAEEEDWEPLEDPIEEMQHYMSFAWDKALNRRGLSANRSVEKIKGWIWLAGEDELLTKVKSADYEPYGKPKLAVIDKWLAENREQYTEEDQ